MAEPSEDDVANFVSFTGVSREQAVGILKENTLNLQKAINAYFENPTAVPSQPENEWESFNNSTPYSYGDESVPTFNIENSDEVHGNEISAPPSHPPSRVHTDGPSSTQPQEDTELPKMDTPASDKSLTAAQREERDLQQAVAMSLGQEYGAQESGVTTTDNPNFGRATRDHYDESSWAMTVFNSNVREMIISPNPEDRRRQDDLPAFLRPSQEFQSLGSYLTVLHSIPLAREALLLRDKSLPDYGQDPQWWNGRPINVPKIVSMDDSYATDHDWDDILYETQRLMAFLDSTQRAFGSTDALASLGSMSLSGYDADGGVSKFLETWQEAAVRATPENPLSMIFSSHALKRPFSDLDPPIGKNFFILDPSPEPEHGQTLYDVLDRAVWADSPGEELDDVWLEHVAEVLTIRLECPDLTAKSIDVKIPAAFYPDRYMEAGREITRAFRLQRLEVVKQINKLDNLISRFTASKSVSRTGMSNKELLEKAAQAAITALPKNLPNGLSEALTGDPDLENAGQRLADRLRQISAQIDDKLKKLYAMREETAEKIRSFSKTLTEPSPDAPDEPPNCRYTLRGVVTAPNVTYVLKRVTPHIPESLMDDGEAKASDWQWWRISFSADDARTQHASAADRKSTYNMPRNADIAGYTATKIREVEVLRAARDESNSVLLVYANSNAVTFEDGAAPPALQDFVNADNLAFQAELTDTDQISQTEDLEQWSETVGDPEQKQLTPSNTNAPTGERSSTPDVNVFDYEVTSFDEEAANQGPEMQEVGGKVLLTQQPGLIEKSDS